MFWAIKTQQRLVLTLHNIACQLRCPTKHSKKSFNWKSIQTLITVAQNTFQTTDVLRAAMFFSYHRYTLNCDNPSLDDLLHFYPLTIIFWSSDVLPGTLEPFVDYNVAAQKQIVDHDPSNALDQSQVIKHQLYIISFPALKIKLHQTLLDRLWSIRRQISFCG